MTWSPSSRRAWIEMSLPRRWRPRTRVALLTEGVDRNRAVAQRPQHYAVALLTEGVDRNRKKHGGYTRCQVALLTEGVDRNGSPLKEARNCWKSPSSRRAWIEIRLPFGERRAGIRSPSSRRAWIEIRAAEASATVSYSRPPHGGRG